MTQQTLNKNRSKSVASLIRDSRFIANGGLTKMWNSFGERTDEIITELNEALVA